MRVLVACEYSGRVREAFRARGHDAWSCDLLPAEDGSPFHIQEDVFYTLADSLWTSKLDLLIAHPPCTHLAVSGSRWFDEKRESGEQQEAIDFFMALARASVPRIAIENPVCIMSSVWREPDQIIQPHEFGHPEFKATCLWLKGLPPLRPTNRLTPPPSWLRGVEGVEPSSPDAAERSAVEGAEPYLSRHCGRLRVAMEQLHGPRDTDGGCMSREAFEMVARTEYPELNFARDRDGEYVTAQTQGWWMGWQLAMGEMVKPLVPEGMNYSDIVRWTPKTVVGGAR